MIRFPDVAGCCALYPSLNVEGGRAMCTMSDLHLLNCQTSVASPATWGSFRNLGAVDVKFKAKSVRA